MDTKRKLEAEECKIKIHKTLLEYRFALVPVTTIVNNRVNTAIEIVEVPDEQVLEAPVEKSPDADSEV